MKKVLALLLALTCLLCCSACKTNDPSDIENTSPPIEDSQTPGGETTDTPPTEEVFPEPLYIEHLTFEFVVPWSESDRILSEMQDLSRSLRAALLEQNCRVDDVTVTISTASGLTGDALENGGVDLAFMPAEDYVACNETVSAVLTTDDAPCSTVLAVSGVRTELDEAFHSALANALLTTDSGKLFLDTYQDGIVCVPATEDAIQAVRDHVAAQETDKHGGN